MPFFSKNKQSTVEQPPVATDGQENDAKKGRPTPSRKEAEAANRRPLVAKRSRSTGNKQADKAKVRAERDREYQAMKTNDSAHMPLRDRGPVKAYIRQFTDARWSLGEFFLIGAFGLLILSMILQNSVPAIAIAVFFMVYLLIILTIIDTWVMWRQLRKRLITKFGEDDALARGNVMYAITRTVQMRRMRLPKPLFKKHGNYPE